ncbi:MAG: lysophospholipid acyltransferase family protein, partial [Opitutales bacterium]
MKRLRAISLIAIIWLVKNLFKLLPVVACWRLGEFLGGVLYWILPSKRKIVRKNLEIVSARHPEVGASDKLIKDIFRRSFANLTCTVKTYGMEPKELLQYVDTNLPEEFLQDIRDGKGSIHCLAHIGNWEVLSKVFTIEFPAGTKFGAIFRPLDNELVNNYVLAERERFGCTMFTKRTSVITLSNFIRDGGNLGILADQRAGKKRKYARPFFGRPSARSKLPALLHRRTGAKL